MTTSNGRPARVGIITDQTGALSFMGTANANTATMVVDDINRRGGLLGHPIELFIEDSATDDDTAAAAAAKIVGEEHVDVVLGGIYSSTRQAITRPVVEDGKTLYIYPEQYEGQESHALIFCTGPVPAQQVEPLFPWLMRRTGAKRFYLPSADYIWPHTMNKKVWEVVTAEGGTVVGEQYFPMDQTDYDQLVEDIMVSGAEVVFNTIVPPGLTPFLAGLYDAGFTKQGGTIVCTYFDENFLNLVPAEHVEGLYGCLDYYRDVTEPFSEALLAQYDERFPGSAMFTAGSACTGMYRGLKLWEAAVNEAGSLHRDDVVAALDHATIAEGPGGPAEMVPGQHHVRLNMYIAQSQDGAFKVVKNLGPIDPREREVSR
jgi:ABC-type branched-subunit amino acid transport system substrate-binding protein